MKKPIRRRSCVRSAAPSNFLDAPGPSQYAYAPSAAIATTASAARRAMLFFILRNFIFPYLPFKESKTTTGRTFQPAPMARLRPPEKGRTPKNACRVSTRSATTCGSGTRPRTALDERDAQDACAVESDRELSARALSVRSILSTTPPPMFPACF